MATAAKSDSRLENTDKMSSITPALDTTTKTPTLLTSTDESVDNGGQDSDLYVIIKHGGVEHKIENLMQDHSIQYLKEQIEELTNVRFVRQKLFGIKSKDGKPLLDELTLEETNFINGMKIMMMGSQEKEIQNVEQASRIGLPPLEDDFDIYDDEEIDPDARIPREPEYLAKIARRVQHYKINMLSQPRPGKKLLVLDIDYTLFDHRSIAQSASELMRPYLHEFLTSAYTDYDIVIWSATSMRYIKAKMDELRVTSNPNYRVAFFLCSAAMISINAEKYGLVNVKALAVIWHKFPQWSARNTCHVDDCNKVFLMNKSCGIRVKAYRESFKNRATDQELLHLSRYLKKIAELDDFSSLDHRHWRKAIDAPKRHKTSK